MTSRLVFLVLLARAALAVAPQQRNGLDPLAFESAGDSHRFLQHEEAGSVSKDKGKGKLPSWLEKPPYW